MDEDEILEQRYRFFTEKGVSLAADYNKMLSTLFTAIIAGLIALVAYQRAGFWSGVFFLAADAFAVLGLAHCLIHMGLSSKLMSAYAALFGGAQSVPRVLVGEETTEAAIRRLTRYAQHCHLCQMFYLFLAALVAGMGLAAMLWSQIRMSGFVLAGVLTAGIVVSFILRTVRSRRPRGSDGEKPLESAVPK